MTVASGRARHRRRTGPGRWLAVVAALGLLGVVAGTTGTRAGWTAATITNAVDDVVTGMLAVTHDHPGGPCVGGPRTAAVTCPPALAPTASPPASAADTITNAGTGAITQQLTASSCAPVRFENAQQATDPLLPRYGVGFRQPDPWGTTSAASFGGTGYATDIVGTNGSGLLGLLGTSYSIGVWFNAADTEGGGLLGLAGSLSDTSSATGNPMMWLDSAGRVRFAASSTLATITGVSAASYSSGWHLAVLTVDTSGLVTLTKTVRLYVDGVQVASASGLTLLTTTSGYWHLGWADFTGLTAPTSAYFHGRLAGAFLNKSTALSAGAIGSLHGAAGATAYRTALQGQSGIASVWMLGDDGVTTYAGALPGTMANPCGQVNVTLAFTGPATTIGPMSLAALVLPASNPRTVAAPAAGQPQSLTVSTAKGSGYSDDIGGLRLYVPLVLAYGTVPASGWTMTMTWAGEPGHVILG